MPKTSQQTVEERKKLRRFSEAELYGGPAEAYEIDPVAEPGTVAGDQSTKKFVRVSRGLMSVCEDVAVAEDKDAATVVGELIREALTARGLLLPVGRVVAKRLLTEDGSVVTVRRVGGVVSVE